MPIHDLVFRGRRLTSDNALVMAIVNRTPDSFYDNGVTFEEERAQAAIGRVLDDGAAVIDIGGVLYQPGPRGHRQGGDRPGRPDRGVGPRALPGRRDQRRHLPRRGRRRRLPQPART